MSGYDPNYVEQKVFVRVGMKSVVYNPQGQILLLKRSDKTSRSGGWDLPGGAMDKDEDPTAGAAREIHEEAGLTVTEIYPVMTTSNWDREDAFIIIGFKAFTDNNQVELSWEHTEYQWLLPEEALAVDPAELPDRLKNFIKASLLR